MAEVASAYVALLPSFRGGAGAISRQLGGPLDTAGEAGGQRFGGGMRTGIAGMATQVFAPLAAAAAGVSLVGFFKGAVDEASGLGESVNALNVVFGDSSAGIQDLGKAAAQNLGLSNLDFNNLAVRFSNFAKTVAGEGGNVTGVLGDLTTRSADFASVMNLDVAEAAGLFQSGLAGETEPLRRYGIDLSAAAVEAYALANGIGDGTGKLTEAEKVQARYGALMEQTAQTAGDFANTSDSLANQQRILAAKFDDTKARIGTALLPALTGVVSFVSTTMLPALDAMGAFLTDTLIPGFQSFAQFVSANAVPLGIVAGLITAVFLPALIAMGVQATISAAKQVAAWIVTQASAIAGAAAQSLAVARTVAGWVLMGAQSLIQAARMAAAWLIAMGPVGLIIAIVVGLVALIIANWDTIVAWTKQAWENVTAWLATAWANITSGVTSAWNGILNFFRAIPGKIVEFFLNWTLLGLLIKHWDSIKEGATIGFNAVVDFIKGIPDRIISGLGNLGTMLLDAGKNIMQGLWNGLTAKWGEVQDWFSGLGDWISEHKGPKQYDLNLLRPAGGWIMTGLQDGIEDELPALRSTLTRVSNAISVGTASSLTGAVAVAGTRQGAADTDPRTGPLDLSDRTVARIAEALRSAAREAVSDASRDVRSAAMAWQGVSR